MQHVRTILSTAILCSLGAAQTRADEPAFAWSARTVEHLLNRAAFGARPDEIARWVEAGPEALVEHLLAERELTDPYFWQPIRVDRMSMLDASRDERRAAYNQARQADRRQLQGFIGWWVEEMAHGDHPLRERMTLFWHGLFTSSYRSVKRGDLMIRQNELFRAHALGSYGKLLHAILQDPAMLVYLDNNSNKRGKPNENLAREVMELFSLGEGHYTEADIKAAARALTGNTMLGGEFRFAPREHDYGVKTILGVTGRHRASNLADILLEQDACSIWIASRLLEYFEGYPAPQARVERYAHLLEEHAFEVAPILRALFLDPDFYREELIGAKVLSPIDFVVGATRRLGLRLNPQFAVTAAGVLGQRLMDPPNVKGWEGGDSWITTATLMQRGNLMGILLGVVELEHLEQDADERDLPGDAATDDPTDDETMMEQDDAPTTQDAQPNRRQDATARMLKAMTRAEYQPRIHLMARLKQQGVRGDAAIVARLLDELLAIEAPPATHEMLTLHLAREREALGIPEDEFLDGARAAELLLRQLAHLVLSLPEAQLG
jgi:uncharacterized protein (DUF1800 family)